MSETAAAAPAPPAAETAATTEPTPPATEAAAPPPEPEKPPEPPRPETREFLALKREKAQLHAQRQSLKQESTQVAQLRSELQGFHEALEKFDDDPELLINEFARRKGVPVQKFFDTLVTKLANKGEPLDPVSEVEKLRAEMRAKEEQAQAAAKAREEAETHASLQRELHAIDQFVAGDPEKYERVLTRGEKMHNDLIQLGSLWQTQRGEQLSIAQALEKLEAQYLHEDTERLTKQLLTSKKLQHLLPAPKEEPAAQVAAPTNAPAADTTKSIPSPPPRTISNGKAAVPAGARAIRRAPQSDKDLVERIAKQVRFTETPSITAVAKR